MDTDTTAPTDDAPLHNPPGTTAADHQDAPDTDAELARWKSTARKWEDRAKANADAVKELDRLKAASMTEIERAIAEAKTSTRAEVLKEFGSTRVADLVRVAAAGRNVDVDALLDGLDKARFLDDDGQPDTKAIQSWIDRVAPAVDAGEPHVPRVPTGPRGPAKQSGDPATDFASFLNGQLKR